jgi:hypothetical protein
LPRASNQTPLERWGAGDRIGALRIAARLFDRCSRQYLQLLGLPIVASKRAQHCILMPQGGRRPQHHKRRLRRFCPMSTLPPCAILTKQKRGPSPPSQRRASLAEGAPNPPIGSSKSYRELCSMRGTDLIQPAELFELLQVCRSRREPPSIKIRESQQGQVRLGATVPASGPPKIIHRDKLRMLGFEW